MKLFFLLIAFVPLRFVAQQTYVEEEWDDYFMPGIGYRVYQPHASDSLGIYQGITTEFVIYANARQGKSRGPSRVKTYGTISILKSNKTGISNVLNANVGLNLSFEANARRKFLLPYFGLEAGGMFQRNFSSFQFIPVLGVQILSNKRFIWSAQAGYNYTLRQFEQYSGMQYSTTFNLLLWN